MGDIFAATPEVWGMFTIYWTYWIYFWGEFLGHW